MKITVDTISNHPELIVEHNGHELRFSASVFTRKSLQQLDVFAQINNYWARMPLSQQDKVFKIYMEIYRGFDQFHSSDELYDHLSKNAKELVALHPLPALETWISMDPSFRIPDDVEAEFVMDEEKKKTPGKTYLRREYIGLVALSVLSRCLMPIFGEYIKTTRQEFGIAYKETYAVQLLLGSGVLESPAVLKLTDYINQITKEKHRNPERILSGNSSEDMDFILLALVIVRRLCVSDVSGEKNLVSLVYSFLYQKVFNPNKSDVLVMEKKFSKEGGGDGDGKRSIFENYRKREEVSAGEIAAAEFGFEDLYGTAIRLAPTITKEEVDRCLATAEALKKERIGDVQLLMLSWTFKRIHSPWSIYYMPKHLVWKNLAVLEAVLWHWGFKYLAILSTSHLLLNQEYIHVTAIDSKGQISDDLKAKITKAYPFIWSNLRKTDNQKDQEPHPVLHAIDLAIDMLTENAWRSTASEDKIIEVFGEMRRKIVIFPTIKEEFAKLVLHNADHEALSLAAD